MLLWPDLRKLLAEDHFAWFVIEAVEALDPGDFFADCQDDRHGRAAHDPQMMVAITSGSPVDLVVRRTR